VKPVALKPRVFPWFDYSRYTFSLGLSAGGHVMLSGHSASAYDRATNNIVVKGGMAEQARTAWDKIAAILEAGGKTLADIVRVVEYVTPAGAECHAEARRVREDLLGGSAPAINVVVVNRLLRPQALIEIEVDAADSVNSSAVSAAREADGLVYLSSIPAIDAGAIADREDVVMQTRAIYQRAAHVLQAFGLSLENVVKTVDYLSSAALPSYKDTAAIRREFLTAPFPAATGIIMPRVAHRDALIQVDFIAAHAAADAVNPGFSRYTQLTYSPAVRAGNMLFLSGMAALDPDSGTALHESDVVAQAEYVYGNIRRVLETAGGDLSNLVRTVEYVTPRALARYRDVARVRAAMMAEPFPTSTGIVCEKLLRPQFQIEIDATASLG
jgi:enamine deaminase RidA (YjgF/YER057c/UK114 family)